MTTSIRFPSAELVRMGDRMVRRFWEIDRVDSTGDMPAIHASVEVRNGAPELRQFSLTSTETGAQVERSVLRNFDFEGMIEYASGVERMNAGVWGAEGARKGTNSFGASVITVDDVTADFNQGIKAGRTARRRKVTPALLSEVARVYREAASAPVRAVEEHFGKSRRTASWYVKQARTEGYLTEED